MSHHVDQTNQLPAIITEEFLTVLRTQGVMKAYLFGSTSRGEELPDSDIDLLVIFQPQNATYGQQFLLAESLQKVCKRPVDVVTNLHPAFAPYIIPTLKPLPL